MKKILTIALIMGLLCTTAWARALPGDQAEKYAAIAQRNIKLLANALELYANANHREYPPERTFYMARYGQGSFAPFVKTAIGKPVNDLRPYFVCPPGYLVDYRPSMKSLNFKLSCPKPERYNLVALYFSTREGLVRSDGTKNKGMEIKKEDPPKTSWKPVPVKEQQAMKEVLVNLWEAYKNKDINKVMEIQKVAVDRAAQRMEKQGKYSSDEVRAAFRGTAQDLFDADGFKMEALNVVGLKFEKKDKTYRVSSFIPIIASNKVQVASMKVRLKIGNIEFEKIKGEFVITRMQMY